MSKYKILIKEMLPNSIVNTLRALNERYMDIYALKSYSQEGEDMILRRIFESKDTGFYIDIGAHHPKRFSNTYYFYKKGWSGINIDAMPNSMKAFNKYRPRDINIEAAIDYEIGKLTYYEFNEPALNGFSEALSILRDDLKDYRIVNSYSVVTKTLNEVLDSVCNELPKQIDFITIDVEGLDFNVLKSIDLYRYKPNLILIEMLSTSLDDIINNEVSSYVRNFGYRLYAKSFNTIFYINEDFFEC